MSILITLITLTLVDVSGMMLHRNGERAVQDSRRMEYQSHVMSLLQQYVCGGVRLNWLAEARRRPGAGQMRQEEERKEPEGNEEEKKDERE